jgi:hypothetical protein
MGRFIELFGQLREAMVVDNESKERALKAYDVLAARMRTQTKVNAGAMILFVAAFSGLLGHACIQAENMSTLHQTLIVTNELLAQVRSEQATKGQVAEVKQLAKEAALETPDIVIRTTDAGAGKKPNTSLVVRPKSAARGDASPGDKPAPPLPAVEIPITLPPGSKSVTEDGGPPP